MAKKSSGENSDINTKLLGKSTNRRQSFKQNPNIIQQRGSLRQEIVCIALIAVGLLLVLSLYTKTGAGAFGQFFNSILKGLFGFGGYLLPFGVIGASLIILFSKYRYISIPKIVISVILFWIVICFIHVPNTNIHNEVSAWEYIKELYTNGGMTNGGFFGGLLANFLVKLFSPAGTYILLIASGIVLLIIVTGKSLFSFLLRCFAWVEKKVSDIKDYGAGLAYADDIDEDEFYEEASFNPKARKNKTQKNKNPSDYIVDEPEDEPERDEIHLINDDIKKKTKPVFIDETRQESDTSVEKEFIEMQSKNINDSGDGFGYDIEVKGVGILDVPEGTRTPLSVMDEELQKPGKKSKENAAPPEEIEEWIKEHESSSGLDKDENEYQFPSMALLRENTYTASMSSKAQILENSKKLEETLKSFGVDARVVEVSKGPAVTRYELSPGIGVKVSKISGLADDLALNLAAVGIRIEAPIPGKSVVGIEIPNKEVQAVYLREVIDDEAFEKYASKLAFAVGKDIAGNVVIADIAKMPHLLIAGSTGSGKSVCINTIITSILYKAKPDEVKLLMIDPKVVELSVYNGIPHLLIPVVTDPKKAAGALNWAVQEMDARYNLFAETVTRDLKGFNAHLEEKGEPVLPQIVIIIDELADLMMTAPGDVESAICRIAQKARAAGIHLVIATQRPSVDVITGLIKTNVPSRLAFAVASGIDSRTILDMTGAEKLLGKGDMLFNPVGVNKPQRIQGAFISDKEVENIVNFIKKDFVTEYDPAMVEKITSVNKIGEINEDDDEFLEEAIEFLVEKEKASVSMLQRRFRIGYNRAARLMENLENREIVGPEEGSKPRKVLMTQYQWQEYKTKI